MAGVAYTPEGYPYIPPQPAGAAPGGEAGWDAFPVAPAAQGGAQPAAQADPWAAFPKAEPKTTATESFGRGVMNAATFNFYDELTGLAKAGGLDPQEPDVVNAIKSLFVGSYRKLRGDKDAEKAFEEQIAKTREQSKTMEAEHPIASVAGNVAGAVALPGAALLRGATLPARIGRGAAVGAGTGGVAGLGAGEGDVAQRLPSAAGSAAVGAGIGAVAPPLIEGGTRLVAAAASKPINMLRAAVSPTNAAERSIGRAYGEAARADPAAVNRLTPQELSPAGSAIVMDTLGQPGRNLARSSGNISGEARDVLNQTLDPRFEEQVPRLVGWLRSTFHYPDVHAQQEAIEQVARNVNRAAYARAHAEPSARAMWDEGFEQIMQAPVVQEAARAATRTGANRAATQGFTPVRNPFEFHDVGSLTPRYTQRVDDQGRRILPNLEYWDHVKRNLDDQISKLQRAGENSAARDAQQLRGALVAHLDELVPTYAQARAGAAHFFGAENALEAGQRFVTDNFAIPQTRAALARMSPSERQLFQDGFVSRYMETLSKVPDRADVVRRIYNTPEARQKIEIALGPQRARELEAMLRVENIMQQSLRAVQGNSTTAMQLIGAGLAGAGGGGFLGFDPTTSGLAAALATAGKKGIDHRVATRIAELLTSRDPAVLRHGARVIANNGRLMDALRVADGSAARIGGQQSTNVPALQAGSVGRADQNEPSVPRPPGQ